MQLLGILLQFLGLFEGFSELTKVGESEASHAEGALYDYVRGLGVIRSWLDSTIFSSQAFHFWMQGDAMGGLDTLLHLLDQGSHVGSGGATRVDNEIGMNR